MTRIWTSSYPPTLLYLLSPCHPTGPHSRPEENAANFIASPPFCPSAFNSRRTPRRGELSEKSVNLSGGGIGVTVTTIYKPGKVLTLTLLLPDQVPFKSSLEVLRLDPVPIPGDAYRLHARFVRMTNQNRELLIRYIVRFQRDHLQEHYSV